MLKDMRDCTDTMPRSEFEWAAARFDFEGPRTYGAVARALLRA
jgi:hypothetical protein